MNPLQRVASGMAWASGASAILLLVWLGVPALESKFAPVATYTTMEIVGRDDDYMLIDVAGEKRRNCRLLEVTALVRSNSEWLRASIWVEDRPLEARSRPTGWQSFGVWKFRPPGDAVRLVAWHRCHGLWETFTNLGEWPLPS